MPFDVLADPSIRRTRPVLCPELELCTSIDFEATWDRCEQHRGGRGLAPPYWASSWPGGQALARHLLDHPDLAKGRRVLDVGAGSGLCAIAAAMCGAQRVVAADIDPDACRAIAANACINGVCVVAVCADAIGEGSSDWDLILAADLWYERFLARRINRWLSEQAAAGVDILIGDVGRAYAPRAGRVELARHPIPAPDGFERGGDVFGCVYRYGSTRKNTGTVGL